MQLLLSVLVNSLVRKLEERKAKGEKVRVKDTEIFLHPQRSSDSTSTLEPRIL